MEQQRDDFTGLPARTGEGDRISRTVVALVRLEGSKALGGRHQHHLISRRAPARVDAGAGNLRRRLHTERRHVGVGELLATVVQDPRSGSGQRLDRVVDP